MLSNLIKVSPNSHLTLKALLAVSSMLAWPAVVFAGDTNTAPVQSASADAGDNSPIEEVMVTATRREESLHDVPVSETVLAGDHLVALLSAGLDYTGLAGKVPSLNVETSNGRTAPRFYIRGYGNTDYTSFASQPVSLIIDGVVQENAALKGFPIFDTENVEVLKGPQGTLFGRNTPAGIINVKSVAPDVSKVSGFVSGSTGENLTSRIEADVNVPLSDTFAVRLSNQYLHRDGYINDPITHDKLDGYNDYAGRVQFLFKPSDNFDALLNVHTWVLDGDLTVYHANIIQPGTDHLIAGFDPYTVYTDTPNYAKGRNEGLNLKMNWDLGAIAVHSITGYEQIFFDSRGDYDGGYGAVYAPPFGPGNIPFEVDNGGGIAHGMQLSQEVRAESTGTGRLQYLFGVFLFHDNVRDYNVVYTNFDNTIASITSSRQKSNSAAGFASVNYKLTDKLEVRGGARLTYDEKKLKTLEAIGVDLAPPTSASTSTTRANWDASATYAINPDVNFYGRVATGYRAPSFGSATPYNGLQIAGAETVISYEGGIKTFLLDKRVRFDFTSYYYRVTNQQLNAVGGSTDSSILLNAAHTVGKGLEAEFDARVIDNLQLSLSGSVNDTAIRDPNLKVLGCSAPCTITQPVDAQGFVSINGNPLQQAPKYIVDASVDYSVPISAGTALFFFGDVNYRSKINLVSYNSLEYIGPPLTEIGLRAGARFNNGKYEVAVFCRNCANEVRVINALDFENLAGSVNQPRVIEVEASAKF